MLFTQNPLLPFEELFKMLTLEECFKGDSCSLFFFSEIKRNWHSVDFHLQTRTVTEKKNSVAKNLIKSCFGNSVNCGFSKEKCLHLAVLCSCSISLLQQVMHMSFLSYLLRLTVLSPPSHRLPFTCTSRNSEEQVCQEFSQTEGKADTHPWSGESLPHDMFFSEGTA